MFVILQLCSPLAVQTPRGPAVAHIVIDRADGCWFVCKLDAGGWERFALADLSGQTVTATVTDNVSRSRRPPASEVESRIIEAVGLGRD